MDRNSIVTAGNIHTQEGLNSGLGVIALCSGIACLIARHLHSTAAACFHCVSGGILRGSKHPMFEVSGPGNH